MGYVSGFTVNRIFSSRLGTSLNDKKKEGFSTGSFLYVICFVIVSWTVSVTSHLPRTGVAVLSNTGGATGKEWRVRVHSPEEKYLSSE